MSNSTRRDFLLKAAATLAAGVSTSALASKNPFGFSTLEQGYENTLASNHAEGKCGGNKPKSAEGKCGEGKCGGNKPKSAEGKCGEGKCGGNKPKSAEGKCGGRP